MKVAHGCELQNFRVRLALSDGSVEKNEVSINVQAKLPSCDASEPARGWKGATKAIEWVLTNSRIESELTQMLNTTSSVT
jgi:hypothetical protein